MSAVVKLRNYLRVFGALAILTSLSGCAVGVTAGANVSVSTGAPADERCHQGYDCPGDPHDPAQENPDAPGGKPHNNHARIKGRGQPLPLGQ